MANLTTYITSFNCAREYPSGSHFAEALFSNLSSQLPPDLIVISLQEIAPIGFSFLGGSFLAPYFSRFSSVLQDAVQQHFESRPQYSSLVVRNVGLTALMVFVKNEVKDRIQWIETAGVGVGVWDMGNKGAVAARLGIKNGKGETIPVTFVAAHLAPMEGQWQRRNEDWRSICEGLVFTQDNNPSNKPSQPSSSEESQPLLSSTDPTNTATTSSEPHTLFSPPSHLFFAGDLNYRTSDVAPTETDHAHWPHPSSSNPSNATFADLLKRDQLTRELNAQHTFHLLSEAPPTFPPTYKYSSAAQKRAMTRKPLNEKDGDVWAKHRVPSWCDRILYLTASRPKVSSYDALPVQPTSDHRPVALWAEVELRAVEHVDAPFGIREGWQERRAKARWAELVVGVASYLALTWEGEMLLAGTLVGILGGWVALRALLNV